MCALCLGNGVVCNVWLDACCLCGDLVGIQFGDCVCVCVPLCCNVMVQLVPMVCYVDSKFVCVERGGLVKWV